MIESACHRFGPRPLNRRDVLRGVGAGFGGLALTGVLAADAPAPGDPLAPKVPHFAARAKRVIFLFMHGGPSQVDTFDHKPALLKYDGQPFPGKLPRVSFAAANGRDASKVWASPWKFSKHGQCGLEVSELYPHVAKCADDLCVINSLHGTNPSHGGAVLKVNTGSETFVRPSMGSWLLYGLGTENRNLPGFIVISPSDQHGGPRNYGSAFLPAAFQGSPLGKEGADAKSARFRHAAPAKPAGPQRAQLDFLRDLNAGTVRDPEADGELEGRLRSFELAARMQLEAPEVTDLSREPQKVRDLYGPGDFAAQCLLARRLAEAGVRFVQVDSGYVWDQHSNLVSGHAANARKTDQAIAGLLTDLKQRGMLDDTLVIWGGEFGRTPTREGGSGRDHNPHGFTYWLAGGGTKGGTRHGATDEFGYYAERDKVHLHDLHATILHLMGLDHEKLTYRYAGRDFRLTDVEGHVVKGVLA